MPTSQVRSIGVRGTVSGRESHSMAVCCRRMVAAHVRSPEKVQGMHIPNAELVSFKIRLDLPKVQVRQAESRKYHPLYYVRLSICMIVSVCYWIWKLPIYSARINGPRTYLPFP